jgi:hypothetical protein
LEHAMFMELCMVKRWLGLSPSSGLRTIFFSGDAMGMYWMKEGGL